MPVVKIENIGAGSALALWEIKESEQDLLDISNLTSKETEEFSSIQHEKKRKEYLAGRLVLKALLDFQNHSFNGVVKDDCGKPFLVGSRAHISLSHSFPYAGAIVNPTAPVGIDIEKPQKKLLNIARRFLSSKEQRLTGEDENKLCIYWCAKEVLYKIYGKKQVIFSKELSVTLSAEHKRLTGIIDRNGHYSTHRLHYFSFSGFIVCFNE